MKKITALKPKYMKHQLIYLGHFLDLSYSKIQDLFSNPEVYCNDDP